MVSKQIIINNGKLKTSKHNNKAYDNDINNKTYNKACQYN